MREENAGLTGCSRVPVGCVRRDLFVPCRHKPDPALPERVEECDDRMTAETKDDLDAKALEIIGQQVRSYPRVSLGFGRNCGRRNCAHRATRCHEKVPL